MRIFHRASAVISVLALVGCNDQETSSADSTEESEASKPEPVDVFSEPENQPSLFAPVSQEHAKSMEERKAEAAEIDRRIEEAAKARKAEMVTEVEEQLKKFHDYYVNQYTDVIQESVEQYQADLKTKYLDSLRQNYDAAQKAGMTMLVQQIAEEAKRVKAGAPIPSPPAPGDSANPGLELLFELRRWYHDGSANIEKSRQTSVDDLTENYRKSLTEYQSHIFQVYPPEAEEKVTLALESLASDWWGVEPPENEVEPGN